MTDALFLGIFGLIAIAGICWELTTRPSRDHLRYTHERGWQDAVVGLGRNDYPIDYTDAEREAWQRGWDEYHGDDA